jgi:outer membrane murein-binding lipoprotein Lpp
MMIVLVWRGVAMGQTPVASSGGLQEQVNQLRALVEQLQARVDQLEKQSPATQSAPAQTAPAVQAAAATVQSAAPDAVHQLLNGELPGGTTINFLFDGYYGYNFDNPMGRVNLLRAYDVSSNAFTLSQADLVLESAPDVAEGKRFGARLDLMFGQATQTLQGNPINEPRPGIYRNIFQAYGTYVVPIGRGLTVDLGKFSSSLGIEGNYTKDQMNYSRSFWFNFLPYYHMGIRANYAFNDKIAMNYWLVNGAQQTEPFNGFKDEFLGLTLTPTKSITWNMNYYLGQEHPDVMYFPNGPTLTGLPNEQGVPFLPIADPPKGKTHIFDSYITWQATPKVTFALEADDVISRLQTSSAPQHTDGGALYAQYQFAPKLSFAARAEYLSDRGGLFSGVTEALKETTATVKYRVSDGFILMGEWRRDFSNQPYFYTDTLGVLKKEQNTATLGATWWFGGKQGAW